jgi:hypothetical protein
MVSLGYHLVEIKIISRVEAAWSISLSNRQAMSDNRPEVV